MLEKALSYVVTPAQSGIMSVSNWVSAKVDLFANMNELYEENERLKAENEILIVENSRLKQVDSENEILSSLLNTARKYAEYPLLYASVSASAPNNRYNVFFIDKGEDDGIKENMMVLSSGGLVGRIAEVWPKAARVVSIIDDISAVSARSTRTSDVGNVRGDRAFMIDGLCRMEFTSLEADIMPGDEIETSHVSSIYPPGIKIGQVVDVSYDSKKMKTAIIKPVVDFTKIDAVLVVTKLFERIDTPE